MRNAVAEGAVIPLQRTRTPRRITTADFRSGQQILERRSVVASYRIPRNTIVEVNGNEPARLQLRAAVPLNITSSGRRTFDLEEVTPVRTGRPAPANPSTAHPDIAVVIDGARAPIVSYDAEAKTVEVDVPDGATEGTAHVTFADGDVRLVAVMPSGLDTREIELYGNTLQALHETDQSASDSGVLIAPGRLLPLGPQWELQIQVNSPFRVDFASVTGQLVELRAFTVSVSVQNRETLNSIIAGRLM